MLEDWNPSRIAWALRKIVLPIGIRDLVLDVGSGGNPHPAADVILDKYIDPIHRQGAQLRSDRPLVLADAGKMPFRDKAFDFVVAFHVLEHVRDPRAFLEELQRVGKAGYIETPNVFFERIVPYDIIPIPGHTDVCQDDYVARPHLFGLTLQRPGPARLRVVGRRAARAESVLDSLEVGLTVTP